MELRTWLMFPASTLLIGCAGLLGSGNRTVILHSDPEGATVFVNGNERGTTPWNYTYEPDDGDLVEVEFRMPGHLSNKLTINPTMKNGILFLEAMLFHIPYIVDHDNPAMYRIDRSETTVRMVKELPTDIPARMAPLSGVLVALGERPELGRLNGKVVRHDKDSPLRVLDHPEQLGTSMVMGFRDTWLDVKSVRKGTTKGDEAIQRAKMHLEPSVKDLRMDIKESKGRAQGKLDLEVLWRFYSSSRSDSVIWEETTRTTHYANGGRLDELVGDAAREAARSLAGNRVLAERLAERYGAGLTASKGGNVLLTRPVPIGFTGRKDMISALVKGVVTISMDKGHGSGFVISNDGYILTNEHVVEGESLVKVKFEQGFSLDGQVVKFNKDFDLALIKVQATDLPALSIGHDDQLMLGEELFAIGTPLDTELGQSVSRGVLSGRRSIEGRSYLQTDVSINPGNSGGPLIDETGKVVGVTTLKISGKGLEGLGFGVPISQALEMLNISFVK